MILYHGSYIEIKEPDTRHSRETVDFGKGFYTTPIYEQAVKWCEKFKKRGRDGVVSKYFFDFTGICSKKVGQGSFDNINLSARTACRDNRLDENAVSKLKVLSFDAYSEEWLDFILNCRKGKDTSDYDIVIGGVANDKVFNTVELYFDGLIDKTEAIKRLRYEKPNLQICFRTEKAIKALCFEGSERL